MWWPSGWPLIPSRLFSHLHLLVAAQAGLEFVCVLGHDGAEEPYDKLQRTLRAETDKSAWSSLYSTVSRLCLLFIHPCAPNLISLRSAGTMPARFRRLFALSSLPSRLVAS